MTMFDGFDRRRVRIGDTELNLRIGGSGPALLLLHGYPQTHVCWHQVAPALAAAGFTVVAPDLKGYGDSAAPAPDPAQRLYAKRTQAHDQVALMQALGFDRFSIVGHDRGARVGYRLALDHPGRVERLVTLDIVPTLEMWDRVDQAFATAEYHWFFLIQPNGLPEAMIGRDPDDYLERTVRSWAMHPDRLAPAAMAEYRRCFRRPEVIAAVCADYRAGATTDRADDAADRAAGRRIACPVLALWARRATDGRPYDPLAVWRGWAGDVRGHEIDAGHFLAEEAPEAVLAAVLPFLGKAGG